MGIYERTDTEHTGIQGIIRQHGSSGRPQPDQKHGAFATFTKALGLLDSHSQGGRTFTADKGASNSEWELERLCKENRVIGMECERVKKRRHTLPRFEIRFITRNLRRSPVISAGYSTVQ